MFKTIKIILQGQSYMYIFDLVDDLQNPCKNIAAD